MVLKPPFGFTPNLSLMRRDEVRLFLPMNRNAGASDRDYSGYGNHATFGAGTAAPTWIKTQQGPGLDFDGINDVLNCGSLSNIDNLPAITCIAYIKPRSAGEANEGQIINKVNNAFNLGYAFNLRVSGAIQFYHTTTGVDLLRRSNTGFIGYDVWQQVALTWDGSLTASNVHLYVNGKEVTYATSTNGTVAKDSDAGNDLLIGNDVTGAYSFNGGMGWILISNKVWSASKIYNYYLKPFQYFNAPIITLQPTPDIQNTVPMRVYAEGIEAAQSPDSALRIYAEGMEVSQSPEAALRVYALGLEIVTPSWGTWGNKLRRMR